MKRLFVLILVVVCILLFAGCKAGDSRDIVPNVTVNESPKSATERDESLIDNDSVDYPTENISADITKSNLTMRTLKALVERYGDSLTWNHFAEYYSEDIGSGLYILRYPIDTDYCLLIGGGSTEEAPIYIKLASVNDLDNYIDIRTESIDDFIKE